MKFSRFDYNPFLFQAYSFAVLTLVASLLLVVRSAYGFAPGFFDVLGISVAALLGWFLDSVLLARLDDYLTRRVIARRLQ